MVDAHGVRVSVASVIILATCATVAPCDVAAQEYSQQQERSEQEHSFEIDRQPVTLAIHAFSDQTGLDIGFFPESPEDEDILVGPVQGTFTAEAALFDLLDPSGFAHEWVSERSVRVYKERTEALSAGNRLISTPTEVDSLRSREWGAIIVIASRLSIDEHFPPSVAMNRQTIESYGVSTLAELLRYLPQIPFMRSSDSRVSGEQYADLRGLGATLILLNGRRVGSSARSFDSNGFDTNTIPLAAIKHIEVFLDASISHGSDALAVINIVLHDDIQRPIVQAQVGSAHGGAEEGRASLGFGVSRNRFRGSATLDAWHREFLFGVERELTKDQDFRRFGGPDMRSIESSPPNISSVGSSNLPGLSSSYAAVPSGGDNLTIADFQSTEGQRNLISSNQWRSIVPRSTRISAVGSAELRLSDQLKLFGEFLGIERHHEFQAGHPTLQNRIVPASNPWNPFGEPVLVNAMLDGVGATRFITRASLLRGVLGAQASFDKWALNASAVWHDDDARLWRQNELDPVKVAHALAATEPDKALNVFRDGPAGSAELLRSLVGARRSDYYQATHTRGQIGAQGPIFYLPAGKAQLHVGGEWQRDGLSIPAIDSKDRETWAALSELHTPLIAPEMQIPFVNAMDMSLGLRADHGSYGTHQSAQYALSWRPVSNVVVRASYRDFWRPPNLYDLHLPRFSTPPIQFPDPGRSNELGTFNVIAGGNVDLMPSDGRSWSAGVEFEPQERMTLSLSYWHTVILDQIVTYQSIPFVLRHEASFPDRVVRADPTPRDLELGVPGAVQLVDVSPGNYGQVQADGVDFAVQTSWRTGLGRISPAVTVSWNHHFEATAAPGFEPDERVAVANDLGTIPRWRGAASVRWEQGAWAAFSALRFVGRYDDAFLASKNGRTIPSSYQLDAQVSAKMDGFTGYDPLQRITVSAGVTNLLDAKPAYSQVFGSAGYDRTQADLRQRFFYLSLEKGF